MAKRPPILEYPYNTPTCALVGSLSRPGQSHLVDLAEWECACEHFQIKVRPTVDHTAPLEHRPRCQHIDAVLTMLGESLAESLIVANRH